MFQGYTRLEIFNASSFSSNIQSFSTKLFIPLHRRAKEIALETRARMRDTQIYESNEAFMEWLDMIEERLHVQNLLDEKHRCSKHPPWFPAGVVRPPT